MARDLRLGLNTGYWGAGPPSGVQASIAEAERLGFDSMWTAEAYGSDVLTPLAWWGSQTTRLRLGTAIVQMSARTPAATAMAAMTMDHLSRRALHPRPRRLRPAGGRGLVRPAVRQAAGPHARVRRDHARRLRARAGPSPRRARTTRCPYPDGTGLGKPLKSTLHPRARGRSRSSSAPRGRRTSPCAPSCATAGWRSSSRPTTRASTARRWPRASRARARAARSRTSRSARRCRSSSTTTSRPPRTCCARCTPCTSAAWAPAGANFHHNVPVRMGYEDEAQALPGPLPRGPQGRGRRRAADRAHRAPGADRPARQDPRRPRGVARLDRHDAAGLRHAGDAAPGRRARARLTRPIPTRWCPGAST